MQSNLASCLALHPGPLKAPRDPHPGPLPNGEGVDHEHPVLLPQLWQR
jgi:hypothetical protein